MLLKAIYFLPSRVLVLSSLRVYFQMRLLILLLAVFEWVVNGAPIILDGSKLGPAYDGHGALSAGASSRLLWDYAEPYRTEIPD